jgi:hypothetical protein
MEKLTAEDQDQKDFCDYLSAKQEAEYQAYLERTGEWMEDVMFDESQMLGGPF